MRRKARPLDLQGAGLWTALVLLAAIPPARAQEGSFRVDNLFWASGERPTLGASDTRSQIIFYEFLFLRAEDVAYPGVQVEFSGTVGLHAGAPPLTQPGVEQSRFLGEVAVGLVHWHNQKRWLSLSVGRQYLFLGSGRAEHLDGLVANVRGPWQLDLTLFGGRSSPWQLDDQPTSGIPSPENEPYFLSNYAFGGRARFRLLERAVASLGMLHEGHARQTVRQTLFVDGGYWRSRYAELLAGAALDTVTARPQQGWLQLISRPLSRLKLSLDYSYQVPGLLIPKTSLFSVFSLDAYQEVAGAVFYGWTEALCLGLEGGLRLIATEPSLQTAYTLAGSFRLSLDDRPGRLIGGRLELLQAEEEGYFQGRLYARYQLNNGLYGSADLFFVTLIAQQDDLAASIFVRRLQEHAFSLGGLAVLGYSLTSWLSAQLTGSAFATPAAQHDLRLMARLTGELEWPRTTP